MSESPPPEPLGKADAQKLTVRESESRRSRFRRAARWLLKWSFRAVVIVLVVGLLVLRGFYYAGQRALRAEEARLDAADPGWRAEELIAARNATVPPDEQNSARVVRELWETTPPDWNSAERIERRKLGTLAGLNRKPQLEEVLGGNAGPFERIAAEREFAMRLCDLPNGHTPLPPNASFTTPFHQHDHVRHAAALLHVEAVYAARNGDARRALRASRALLNAGRSLGDGPVTSSALDRLSIGMVATECAIRTLALCEASGTEDELAALQTALSRELDAPIVVNGLRGERAFGYRTSVEIANPTGEPDERGPVYDPSLSARAERFVMRSFFPESQRRYLAGMTDLIEAVKGPPEKLRAAVRALEDRLRAERDARYRIVELMPALHPVATGTLRHRALLGSTVALLACERFRLKHGRFPNALAELPKDLLASVPLDPYTGAPLSFVRTQDGIAVISHPSGDELPPKPPGAVWITAPLGGDEYGWRLYDVKHRGLPPLPKPMPEPELP